MDQVDTRLTRSLQSNVRLPLRETASQTAGPYVHLGCLPAMAGVETVYPRDLTSNNIIGGNDPIEISGSVFDGDGTACKDIMLEFWQPDEDGNFSEGVWRRTATNSETGVFSVRTVMPGKFVNQDGVVMAPFISVWIVARGINVGLMTRIYFPDFSSENSKDPHLAIVPAERRTTLIAGRTEMFGNYKFDIHLQGHQETVFFET